MEHKKRLEELHNESLQKFEEYVNTKGPLKDEDHSKLHKAKEEWQLAWAKMMETLMVLERLGI